MEMFKHIQNLMYLLTLTNLLLIRYAPLLPTSRQGTAEDILTIEKVRWWSDFNRVYYHPRSAVQINQYQLDTSPFESFTQGRELFKDIDKVGPSSQIEFT